MIEAQARYGMEITDYVPSEPVIALAEAAGRDRTPG